jgi:hypothetical protein
MHPEPQVSSLVQIADVQQDWRCDVSRDRPVRTIDGREVIGHSQRRDGNSFARNLIGGRDLAGRELGIGQHPGRAPCAPPIEHAAHGIALIGIPLGMTLVADIVNRQHHRRTRPQRRGVRGRVNHIHPSPRSSARQTHRAPSEIGRRMPGLADVREIRRHRVAVATECHQFKPRIDGFQGRHERRDITTNAGRWRAERATIDTHA